MVERAFYSFFFRINSEEDSIREKNEIFFSFENNRIIFENFTRNSLLFILLFIFFSEKKKGKNRSKKMILFFLM